MKKRLFSILLALCMVVCLVPTTAFAESETEETPVCTCEIACTEETMNTECPVCGAEGALAENCGKYAEPAAEGEASQPEGEELQENQDSDMPDTQSEAALAQVSGEGENDIAVQSAGVAIDNTNFPDANFRTFVKNFDTNKDDSLSDTEIAAVEEIDCYDKGISNLKGIEYFTALRSLNCGYNQLTALDVSKNTTLTKLYCKNNQLTVLDVSKNTALTYLRCNRNQLTSLDVSKNTALTKLYCSTNQLTSLDVSKNTALTKLDCYNNQLTSLDVSKNTALTGLNCGYNQLTALDVSKNTALTWLACAGNQLTALDVSKNTALTELDCDKNQLTSLDVSNTDMDELDCDDNIYQIVVGNDRTFDLSTLPGNFNVAKTSDWSGGTVSGNTLTVDSDQDTVTYKYDCGNNKRRTFTLKCVESADYANVDAAIAKANALNKDDYKDFSAVDSAVNAVVRGKNITEQSEVDAMAKAIEDAIAALQYKDADYTKVDEAIAKANALNKDDYKDFSAVDSAVNAVVRGKNITEQSEVDAMAKAIEDAIAALQYKDADYTKVDEAIAKANALNKNDYKDFSAVESAVNAVVRGKNITEQSEVDAMAKAIEDAIAALQYKEKPKICKGGKEVKISNGAHEMRIHGKSYGMFTFAWVNYKAGWSIQNADGKYLSFANGKLVLRDTAYVWKYDAKFYTTTEEKTSSGWGWWGRPSTKGTNWYLVGGGTDLSISKSDTNADVKLYDAMESTEHSFGKWTPAEDGKHTRTCTICGATETGDCTYENGACTVCGALDPDNASVSVSATVTKRISGGGGWWWKRPTTTTWEARITATGNGVDIDKVEYSDDGKHYLTGTSFTSDTEITKFYIRVTDSKGNVTKWLYENGKVTQK
jgi:Leucine-rich repeat (LRR) protein